MARLRGPSRHLTTAFKMTDSEHGHAWSPGVASYYQESRGLHLLHNCAVSLRVLIVSTAISLRGTLVHLDLQPVTLEQARLVDFDTVVSTCQGRQCGHRDVGARARHQQVPTSWPKVDKVAPSKLVENHHEFNGVSSHTEYLVISFAKELQRDD